MDRRPYETARIDELERPDGWSPVRRKLGVRSFGVNAWRAHEVGGEVISPHEEQDSGHEELYLVTAGRATFTLDGDQIDAPAGTFVFVPDPETNRGAVAAEPDTLVVSMGARPGEVFHPLAWETNRDVIPLLDQGRNAEAKRVLLAALDEYEEKAVLYYNLACADAQLGETDEAFAYLRRALAERPPLADLASHDSDLDPVRDDPRFGDAVTRARES